MRSYTLFKLIILPLLLCFSLLAHADKSYSHIFIFGDSLSDTGNIAATIPNGIPAPYFNNRITNGPVAMDTLTAKYNKNANASLHLIGMNEGTNYSVAGATASPDYSLSNDLDSQITAFQANYGYDVPDDALYILFLGGNDVRVALRQASAAESDTILNAAKTKIINTINLLQQMGARSFLVINTPNIALIPETRITASLTGNPEYIKQAEMLTKKYNKALHKAIHKLSKNSDLTITEFNLFKLFNKIVRRYDRFNFRNNLDACFSTISQSFHIDCNNGLAADQFVFFDEIHPTAKVHALFAEAFYKKLSEEEDGESENDKD